MPFLVNLALSLAGAGWQQLAVGAGGFQTGHDIAADGSMVVRCDGGGGPSIWNPNATAINGTTGVWQVMTTAATLPGYVVASGTPVFAGTWEIQFCYNNSSILYAVAGYIGSNLSTVYKTTNKGQSWTATGFTPQSSNNFPWNDGNYKYYSNKLGVDPNNANKVFLGSQGLGMFVTQDGGATWTAVASGSLPFGTGAGIAGIIVNPLNSNQVFAFVEGTGLYVTTNANLGASATWTLTTGGPTTGVQFDIDHSNGAYYATSSNNLWKYVSGAWTEVLVSGSSLQGGVAVDPNTAGHIIVCSDLGNLNESFNSGSTWSGFSGNNNANGPAYVTTGDIPWLSFLHPFAGPQGIFFDRSVANKLYTNTENAFFNIQLSGAISTTTVFTMNAQSRGFEQLTCNHVVASATSVVLGSWDYPLWYKTNTKTSLSAYESDFGLQGMPGINACWSLDSAPGNASFYAAFCDGQYGGGIAPAGFYSNDAGQTWTKWTTAPAGVNGGGGCIAVSSPSNILLGWPGGVAPFYTTNGTATNPTWTQIVLPGNPTLAGNFIPNFFHHGIPFCADKVNAGTFYLVVRNSGTFITTNSGATWTAGDTAVSGAVDGDNLWLKAVPGIAGDIWLTLLSSTNNLAHSTNGGVSWSIIPGITNAGPIGFGAAKPGGSGYPAIYLIGNTTVTSSSTMTIGLGAKTLTVPTSSNYFAVGNDIVVSQSGSNYMLATVTSYNSNTGSLSINTTSTSGSGTFSSWTVYIWGVWQSDDTAATWKLVGGEQWPNGSLTAASDMCGDPNIYGQVYVSTFSNGWACFVSGR